MLQCVFDRVMLDSVVHKNIPYNPKAPSKHPKQQLDIYCPNPQKFAGGLFPVNVHVHGGGWIRGDRSTSFYGAPAMGDNFARKGVVCVAVSYRLSGYPKNIRDLGRAIAWVMGNVANYGGDTSRLTISGHSAGAHLVSLLVLDPQWLQRYSLHSSIFSGVFTVSGIYNVQDPLGEDWKNQIYKSLYTGKTFDNNPDVMRNASPLSHLQAYLRELVSETENLLVEQRTEEEYTEGAMLGEGNVGINGEEISEEGRVVGVWLEEFSEENTTSETKSDSTSNTNTTTTTTTTDTTSPSLKKNNSKPLPPPLPPFLVFNASLDLGLETDGKRFYEALQQCHSSNRYFVLTGTHGTIGRSPEVVKICCEHIFKEKILF